MIRLMFREKKSRSLKLIPVSIGNMDYKKLLLVQESVLGASDQLGKVVSLVIEREDTEYRFADVLFSLKEDDRLIVKDVLV